MTSSRLKAVTLVLQTAEVAFKLLTACLADTNKALETLSPLSRAPERTNPFKVHSRKDPISITLLNPSKTWSRRALGIRISFVDKLFLAVSESLFKIVAPTGGLWGRSR